MKTITTLIIAAAASFSLNANAGVNTNNLNEVFFLNETVEEEYQHTSSTSEQNISSIITEMERNPPAAGGHSASNAFFLNENLEEEYQ